MLNEDKLQSPSFAKLGGSDHSCRRIFTASSAYFCFVCSACFYTITVCVFFIYLLFWGGRLVDFEVAANDELLFERVAVVLVVAALDTEAVFLEAEAEEILVPCGADFLFVVAVLAIAFAKETKWHSDAWIAEQQI